MAGHVVAILGTRFADLRTEAAVLEPLGARIVRGDGATPADVIAEAGDADVILAGSGPRFDADVLGALRCAGIVRYGVGTDTIDADAAAAAGIRVARVSDYGTEAVAMHTVTLVLAAIRRLTEADARLRGGGWGFGDLRPLHLPSALTAGVVGFGRIGRATAGYLAGLGFRVLASDPYTPIEADFPVEGADLDDLLRRADVISLHVPGDALGGPLLGAERLATLKQGSVVVNTARGSLIDLPALAASMADDRPRVAALDVFDREPPDLSVFEPVRDRLIATPHMAWYTAESENDLRTKAAHEAARILRGEPLRDPVVEPDEPRRLSR